MSEAPNPTLEGLTQHYVLGAKSGDAAEFARLYEHIAPAVYTWASLRLRPEQKTVLDPTDLVQEVWLRAWRKIETFDVDRIPFRFWIFRIAKNVALEASRQARKPDRSRQSPGELDPLDGIADTITGVSARAARDESLSRFQEAVAALPESERKLVLHCGLEGLPHREVGERLGISEEAAGKRWQRLRQRLQTTDLPAFLLDAGQSA